jgi:hypothetical protein
MKIPVLSLLFLWVMIPQVHAQIERGEIPLIDPENELPEVLNGEQIAKLVKSVDRGLGALKSLQREDGSFPTPRQGQPAVTSLAIMAYLSRGHLPGEGPYGETLSKAINYVLAQQKGSGLFALDEIDLAKINTIPSLSQFHLMAGKSYSHAISMLMLGEVYGLSDKEESFRIRNAIERGLKFTIQLWDIRKPTAPDDGGFRYTRPWTDRAESDFSVTGWHAASLRSIRNAGFDVPQSVMDRIAAYILRNQNRDGGFGYLGKSSSSTFTMTAAGTLCLALAGKYDDPVTKRAASYLSRFRSDNRRAFADNSGRNWPYYGCYYLTQSSIQLGGQLWVTCMGQCSRYLLAKQSRGGLWPPEGTASSYGSAYSTSMAIIALTPTLQVLPIYQR